MSWKRLKFLIAYIEEAQHAKSIIHATMTLPMRRVMKPNIFYNHSRKFYPCTSAVWENQKRLNIFGVKNKKNY